MKSFKLKIPQKEAKEQLTIIFEDSKRELFKIETPIDDFLKSLCYFQNKSKEIQEIKSIYIHENIQFSYFDEFIKSISTQELEINEDNYKIYYDLSKKYEFNELYDQINDFIQNRPDINSIIDHISSNSPSNTNNGQNKEEFDESKEELLSKNLDICLKNRNMQKIPIENLIRILNSPKRLINDHHLLFSFVISMIKMKKNEEMTPEEQENFFLLPSCLDYCKMSENEIDELFKIENSNNFFEPCHSKEKIQYFISIENEMNKKIDELQKQIKNNESFYMQQLSEMKELFKESMNKIETVQSDLELREKKINEKFDQIETSQNSCQNKIDEHDLQIVKNQKTINDINEKIKKVS